MEYKIESLKAEWIIFGIGKQPPNIAHSDKNTAIDEAQRLSRLHPGTKFLVCKIDSIVETVQTTQTTLTSMS